MCHYFRSVECVRAARMAGVEERQGEEKGGEERNLVDRTWAHYTGEITSSAHSKRKQVIATLTRPAG